MDIVAEMNLAEYFEDREQEIQTSSTLYNKDRIEQCQKELLQWSSCLIRALAHIHKQRVRHKDIKPQNILIKKGRVFITDFGISKSFEEGITTMTFTDPRPRTLRYCAPEVAIDYPN